MRRIKFKPGPHKGGLIAFPVILRVLWSNTWRKPFWNFKRKRSMPARGRRVGNHPRGLAMDASVLVDRKGVKYIVQPHWEKFYGGPGNCVGRPKTKKGRLLRRVTCALEKHHIFRRILTPDSNRGHRHYFHFTAPQGQAQGRAAAVRPHAPGATRRRLPRGEAPATQAAPATSPAEAPTTSPA